MNKKVLILVPLCLIGFHGTSQVTAQVDCPPMSTAPMPTCQPVAEPRININNISKNISPRNVCARPGQTIRVNVTPANTTVKIFAKTGSWPNESGSSFTITAPEVFGDYNYNVRFADNSCLDPRITVKR